MLLLKIIDVVFLAGLVFALFWMWNHLKELRRAVIKNDAMPREASRGLVYGAIIILIAGAFILGVCWLF